MLPWTICAPCANRSAARSLSPEFKASLHSRTTLSGEPAATAAAADRNGEDDEEERGQGPQLALTIFLAWTSS